MPGVRKTVPQPKEGSRGRYEAEIPPVHGPSGYQPADTPVGATPGPEGRRRVINVSAGHECGPRVTNVVSGSRSGVGAGIALRLPHPALRRGKPLLVGLPEPGQR